MSARSGVVMIASVAVLSSCTAEDATAPTPEPALSPTATAEPADTTAAEDPTTSATPVAGAVETISQEPIRLDWSGDGLPITVEDWTIDMCEADASFFCVTGPDEGKLEVLSYPLESMTAFQADVAELGIEEALSRYAREYVEIFAEDREAGCPEDYVFHPIEGRPLTLAGHRGVRYGFTVTGPDAVEQERIRGYAAIVGEEMIVISTEGLGPNACVPAEGPTFTPEGLAEFESVLNGLTAGSRWP